MNGLLVVAFKGDEGKLTFNQHRDITNVMIQDGQLYLHDKDGILAIYASFEWVNVQRIARGTLEGVRT